MHHFQVSNFTMLMSHWILLDLLVVWSNHWLAFAIHFSISYSIDENRDYCCFIDWEEKMMPMMPSFYFEQIVPSATASPSASSSSSFYSSPAASVLVEKATSYLLIEPDWALNMQICDAVDANTRYYLQNFQFLILIFWSWPCFVLEEIRASISCLMDFSIQGCLGVSIRP